MKAVVLDRYGPADILRVDEVDKPEPSEDEVLIKVHATTVNRTDWGVRAAEPFMIRFFLGLIKPKVRILGSELAGVVEAVGSSVTEFKPGDRVFGINPWKFGAYAEYMCVRESAPLSLMPAGMAFDEAAAVCDGGILALNSLRLADLKKGQKILIYGATGSIGTAGVQLARHVGATVTAVSNTKNVDLIKSLGADVVIDYMKEDFTKGGEQYDVIFDAVDKLPFSRCHGSLKPGGVYVATDGLRNFGLALWTSRVGDRRVRMLIGKFTKADVVVLKELIEAGKYRPVIDRRYPLEQVVDATRYVETLQKTGNVVLTVEQPAPGTESK